MKCMVCDHTIEQEEVAQHAAFGGLPSPCCKICFQVNDYTTKNLVELAAKSLVRRADATPSSSTNGKTRLT